MQPRVFILLMAIPDEVLRELTALHEVLVPPVAGVSFFSARGLAAGELDRWWQRNVQPGSVPVFLARDEPGLELWIPGSDGDWYVGIKEAGRAEIFARVGAITVPDSGPDSVLRRAFDDAGWADSPPIQDLPRHPYQPISYDAVSPVPAQAPVLPPIPDGGAETVLQELNHRLATISRRWQQRWHVRPDRDRLPEDLGARVNAHRPIVVGFGSRKGGVGKTTHAAAVAACIGEALDGSPDTAALVDANVTNPDSWALNPPADSATVRTLVSRLADGRDPPAEQYALTPRLAIYPESRDSDELYTQAEVDIVIAYLKLRHAFLAIDLPNALPSLTSGGPGAVAAAWLHHCDVIVLPFNADPRARQGLLEFVAVVEGDPDLADTPVVAPYITPSDHAIARDAGVQADIASLRRSGVQIVSVPDDDRALLALLKDLPISRASPALRRAYLELTSVVVSAAIRHHEA